jgi:hypothetical protein
MWQSKREISRECNDIIGSAKGSQISEKYWGEVGKGKRVDVYLEVRKRRGHIFFEWNKCLCSVYPNKIIDFKLSVRQVHSKSGSALCLQPWPLYGMVIANTTLLLIGNLLVAFDLYYPINLVTTFSWPPTRDTKNYQLLVICHARSNVTSLNLSLEKKVKMQQQNHKAVLKLWNYRWKKY